MASRTREQKRQAALAALAEAPTYSERLVEVRKAIDMVLKTGQSITYAGRTWSASNLADLRKIEKEYENASANELARSPGRSRVSYITPQT